MKERTFPGQWFTDEAGAPLEGSGSIEVVVTDAGEVVAHVATDDGPVIAFHLDAATSRELARWLAREVA